MHDRNVLHRDIKTQNIFLCKKEGGSLGCVKIADFGISKVLDNSHQMARTMVGTPYYLSPEICQKQPYAMPSDVWALGCVLYELCAMKVPFEAADLNGLVDRIVRGSVPRVPSTYSRELSDLCNDMLTRDARRRPLAAAILQRSMLQKEIKVMLGEQQSGGDDQEKDRRHDRAPSARGDRENAGHGKHDGKDERGRGRAPRPLGDNNARGPSPQPGQRVPSSARGPSQGPSRGHSRDPSPHKGAAKEVLRPSRAPSPRNLPMYR